MLEGKVALVTGGSRGIGKAIVKALSDAGAYVVFTYQSDKLTAARTFNEISYYGNMCAYVQLDIRFRKWIQATLKALEITAGKLDILVNNAGINIPTDFDKITDKDWNEVMLVNLHGPFAMIQEALPYMNSGGSIINIGSVSGQYGGPRTAHYAASKAGLIALTQVVARFRPDIRCNVVSPGLIESPMADEGLKSQQMFKMVENIIQGRLGTPEEVADTVVWLASDKASYITGQVINVNGGLYF